MTGPAFNEAVNTLEANRWTLLMASLFGKKVVATDSGIEVTIRHYRGVAYLMSFRILPERQ